MAAVIQIRLTSKYWKLFKRSFGSSHALCRGQDERYLQKSKIPTMHFQPSLPRLPIPKLLLSCQRYLAAQKPLLTDEEYAATKQIAMDFGREESDGWELNKRLIEQDKKNSHTSYITDYWNDMYLRDRRPIFLDHNPCLIFNDDPRSPTQTDRAANIIYAAVKFKNSLFDNKLKPEVYHLNPKKTDKSWFDLLRFIPSAFSWYGGYFLNAFPLDMVQYERLFNTTRLPRPDKDELVMDHAHGHIVVMRNGHMYSVQVQQADGMPVDISSIHNSLEAIKAESTPPTSHSLGYLTTMERDQWAKARKLIISDAKNEELLKKVDSALFVVCLDDEELVDIKEGTNYFLHNRGRNRWFDKSFQLILSHNSIAGVNFEHAWGDGVAVLRFMNEIFKETTENPRPLSAPSSPAAPPERLDFNVSEEVRGIVDKARCQAEERCDTLSVDHLIYEKFGKNFLKQKGLSPDGVLQLAFQVAYYRQNGHSCASYESCATAAFKHGRTEVVRPASVSTKKCAMAFESTSGASNADKIKLIKESVMWHSKLVKDAATGQGFDRHLFALKCLAEQEGLETPQIFQDPAYTKLNHIILSTSTLSSDALRGGGFAPVNNDCYGVGYVVWEDRMGTNITSYPSVDGPLFNKYLSQVLDDLHSVLDSADFNNTNNKASRL